MIYNRYDVIHGLKSIEPPWIVKRIRGSNMQNQFDSLERKVRVFTATKREEASPMFESGPY